MNAGATPDEAVRAIVRRLAPAGARTRAIAGETRLTEDLGYDSLALIELAFALEKELALPPISETDVIEVATVADVEAFVAAALRDD